MARSRILYILAAILLIASQSSATAVDDPECARACEESLLGEDCQSCSLTTFLIRDEDFFGDQDEDFKAMRPTVDLTVQKGDDDEESSGDDDDDDKRRGRNDKSAKGCSGFDEKPDIGKGERKDLKDRNRHAKKNMRLAKRYGDKTRALYLGDSITRDWGKEEKCTKKIYDDYDKKGLNFGIGQLTSRGLVAMTDWIFSESDLAPQIVYVAIGINDCQEDYPIEMVADAIIRTVKAVKYYSPHSAVVVQKILPADDDKKDWEGEKFKKQDLYECVVETNKIVEKWVKDNEDKCISSVDFEDFVLDDGKFRKNVLGDGVHFTDGGDMKEYCKLIEKATKKFDDYDVQARSTGLEPWRDVEPIIFTEEGETYYNWKYNEWSNCTGACGSQRRTVECHRFDPGATDGYTVMDSFCEDVFLNPLERVCDLTEQCLMRLDVPAAALVHQPGTVVLNRPSGDLSDAGCPTFSPLAAVLAACCAALGVLLIIASSMLVRRGKHASQAATAEGIIKSAKDAAPAAAATVPELLPAVSQKSVDVEEA